MPSVDKPARLNAWINLRLDIPWLKYCPTISLMPSFLGKSYLTDGAGYKCDCTPNNWLKFTEPIMDY
jgi:hypothetical protein